jgi:hypothetical protein
MVRKVMALLLISLATTLPVATLAKDQSPERVQCARPIPQAIINKAVFPKSKFVLKNIDYGAVVVPLGLETVEFNNGDKLVITNSGCEYFMLSFQFETSQGKGDVTDAKYWFTRSVELMRQTEKGIDKSVGISRGIKALENYSKNNKNPLMDKNIDYGGQDIRYFFKLEEVKKLDNNRFILRVSFSVGPL